VAVTARCIAFVLASLAALVPGVASAQGFLEGVQQSTDDARGEPSDPLSIGFSVEGSVDTAFFAHEDFGFGFYTLEGIVRDSTQRIADAGRWTAELTTLSTGDAVARALPWFVLLTLLGLTIAYDARVRRWFEEQARKAGAARDDEPAWRIAVRRGLIRTAGRLVLPTLLWMLSYVPVQGLFDSAPWTRALSNVLQLFIVYRGLQTLVEEALTGDYFPVPEETGRRLRRVIVSSMRFVVGFGALTLFLREIEYREDAWALSQTLFRVSVTVLSVRLFSIQTPLLSLLPEEGSERYQRFRTLFARSLRYFLVFSVLLLALWSLGFRRAAATILVRSYLIVGLLVGGALAQRWYEARMRRLTDADTSLVSAVLRHTDSFARTVVYIAFGSALLMLLGLYEPLLALLDALRVTIGTSPITLLNLLKGLAIISVAILVSRVLRTLLDHAVYPWLEIEVGAGYALSMAVHYFLVVAAVGMALVTIGLDLSAMAVFAGALGVGIGFGLQDIARNLVSGFILLFGRSVEKGDLITVSGDIGYVDKVSTRAVTVLTRDNTELVIPSADLVNSTIINWTHSDPWVRLHVPVGVSYGCDVHVVEVALRKAARRYPLSSSTREPEVWLKEFGDSSVNFELLVWIDGSKITPEEVQGRILFYVWDALKEHDIEIPFPQRDLHVKSLPSAESIAAMAQAWAGRGAKGDDGNDEPSGGDNEPSGGAGEPSGGGDGEPSDGGDSEPSGEQ